MAAKYLSPGKYEVDGVVITAKTRAEAEKKAAKKSSTSKKTTSSKSSSTKQYAQDEKVGRKIAEEMYGSGSLGRMGDVEQIGQIQLPGQITRISTDMAGGAQSIAQAEDNYTKSRERDMYVEEALKRGLSSLEGFNAQENQALKAQAVRGINSDAATQSRAMKQQMAENGVSGGAALRLNRQAGIDKRRLLAGAETDLAVANLVEKGKRLDSFASQSQSAAAMQASIQDQALGRLLGARKDVADYKLTAEGKNQEASAQDAQNQMKVGEINAGIQGQNIGNAAEVQKYNNDQLEKEKAGYLGTMFGSMGISEARRNQQTQDELSRQYLNFATKSRASSTKKKTTKKPVTTSPTKKAA